MTEIVVLSGKGGTGKTSISAAFATLNEAVMVADCDVDAANLFLILQPEKDIENRLTTGHKAIFDEKSCSQCGLCVSYCRFGAITFVAGKISISETACDGCFLCSRLCPSHSIRMIPADKSRWFAGNFRNGRLVYARLEPGEENSGKLVNIVREYAKTSAKENGFQTIIIDGPPGIGCPAISAVTGADKAIIVTEPTRSGFHDMKRILNLTANFKIKSYVIINKYDLNEDMTRTISEWCVENEILVAGMLPFDQEVVTAMINSKSMIEWKPESDVSIEIKRIWNRVYHDN